jgi:serine/threonine-protein kinase
MGAVKSATRTFGRYELVEYLGSGAMSDVFVAMHVGLRKRVALKMLRPSLRHEASAVARFSREGAWAARVSHPNVVAVTDVGVQDEIPFLVMELLEGETLEEKLCREGPFSLSAAVDIMLPLLEGVAAIHAAGVLHRDIKPANVLLARMPDGTLVPKLVDFGIATVQERRNITGALGPIGTPHYMSPEQARGMRGLDEKSDQYSLASMLFECLIGREPFAGGDVHAVLTRVARGRFPLPSQYRSGLPAALDDVMARATSLDPAQRFASASEFARALLPFASSRTRRFWNSRDGILNTARLQVSGLWKAFEDRDPRSASATITTLRKRRLPARAFSGVAVASFALALGVFVGTLLVSHKDGAAVLSLENASAQRSDALASAPPTHSVPRDESVRRIVVSPSTARIEVDGRPIVHDAFFSPRFDDDRVHELRVSAPGHVTRVALFRRSYEGDVIALEPIGARPTP